MKLEEFLVQRVFVITVVHDFMISSVFVVAFKSYLTPFTLYCSISA